MAFESTASACSARRPLYLQRFDSSDTPVIGPFRPSYGTLCHRTPVAGLTSQSLDHLPRLLIARVHVLHRHRRRVPPAQPHQLCQSRSIVPRDRRCRVPADVMSRQALQRNPGRPASCLENSRSSSAVVPIEVEFPEDRLVGIQAAAGGHLLANRILRFLPEIERLRLALLQGQAREDDIAGLPVDPSRQHALERNLAESSEKQDRVDAARTTVELQEKTISLLARECSTLR